ncbi:O-antigen translocase [Devosia sp.]|uniref:O-antigen translocase n=1 Tax=Devosia sp. TaxID=1871048 RepID=UPI00261AC4E3|nr:O-antigen translocase [Devosia sp.]
MKEPKPEGYRDILRSTALIGASTIVVTLFALIRMKALAVLLGPAGIGLMALFSSVADLATSAAGMGVQQSGVRQIAQATGTGEQGKIATTIAVLKRTSLVLGLAGGAGLALLCVPASQLTFGTADYALAIALLGLVVFLRLLAGAQTALIQGSRRIGHLAMLSIFSAAASVLVTVPVVFFWGEAAIVPSLILTALAASLVAWWYGRRIHPPAVALSRSSLRAETGELLRLGVAFMVSGFLTMGAAYAIRIVVLHDSGVLAAGLYQAAWAVAGLYVGFVLQAMGADFYPRLTGVADDNVAVARLVNEQTEISLLLAGPGVIATITLAPLAIASFYSSEFAGAESLLRWLCLGMMLRVVAWPMGFIIVAKGWQKMFIVLEIAAAVVHVGLAALLVPLIGLDGAGVAFASLYFYHSLLVYLIVRRRCGFRLSPANRLLLLVFGPATAIAFGSFLCLPFWWATGIGLVVSGATGVFSLSTLGRLIPTGRLPQKLQSWYQVLLSRRGA